MEMTIVPPKRKRKSSVPKPFILKFMQKQKGFSSGTTSGVWNDVDASDKT